MIAYKLDITESFSRYREAARHIWNTAFRVAPVNFDDRDSFSRVASELFKAIVLDPIGLGDVRLSEMSNPAPSHFAKIAVVPSADRIPILVNRETKEAHGYWDDPVNQLGRDEADLRFVQFFDWDELGARDFEYVLVRIVSWHSHPHLVTRYALVEYTTVKFRLLVHEGNQTVESNA